VFCTSLVDIYIVSYIYIKVKQKLENFSIIYKLNMSENLIQIKKTWGKITPRHFFLVKYVNILSLVKTLRQFYP